MIVELLLSTKPAMYAMVNTNVMGASPNVAEAICNEPAMRVRPPGAPRRRYRRALVLSSLSVVVAFGLFVTHLVLDHNFHVVSPGLIYRSAQLDAGGLTQLVQEHGIKSILNLRGPNGTTDWYNAETNTAHLLGVRHIDFELSASRELSDDEMERLLAVVADAPKPLLIHCKSGADRTGLVGALYLYSAEGKSAEAADRELTVFCGHIPYLFWRDTIAMDRSFWRYVADHAQTGAGKLNRPLTKQEASPSAVTARVNN
ncbi:MAG: protein tyrosine phosphatase [Pedosphaera sp.]|nr:protein tyrosine phosphatase [Pedosphaera sp.]